MSNDAIHWARRQTVGGCGRKAVLLTLADRADEAWSCFPGQALIATETEQSVRSVRNHLAALEEAGYIERIQRRRDDGSRTSDRYKLNHKRQDLPLVTNRQPLPPTSGNSSASTGNQRQANRQLTTSSPATVAGHEPKEEPKENHHQEESSRKRSLERNEQAGGSSSTDDFDVFWSVYPRRSGKAAARKAWTKARKEADAELIIGGAHVYASDPNRDPAFTKHPTTWLNQGCWDDEPLPARTRTGAAANQQHHDELFAAASRRASAAENTRTGLRAIGDGR